MHRDKPFILEVHANEYTLRAGNPRVPWTVDEIVADALVCAQAGAAIYHFHARMPDGAPDHRLATYQEIIRRIKGQSDILVHPTLGAITLAGTAQERLANVEALCRDAATKTHKHFAQRIPALGLKPYVMSWSVIYTRQIEAFLAMGLIQEPVYLAFNMTEGHSLAGHPGSVRGLTALLDFLPAHRRIEWTACVHGGTMLPLLGAICEAGGHASIGLGDYPYQEFGTPGNADIVRWVGQFTAACARPLATPAQAREFLQLP